MWARLDDGILDHPKIASVGTLGFAWFAAGLVYSNRNLTDGFIPYSVATRLLGGEHVDPDGQVWEVALTSGMTGRDLPEAAPIIVGWLLDANLWEEVPGGYRIHDFEDWNKTKAEVLALRKTRSEAGRRGGVAKAKAGAKQTPEQESQQTAGNGSSKTGGKTEAKSYPAPAPAPAPEPSTPNGVEVGSTVSDSARSKPRSAPISERQTAILERLQGLSGWDTLTFAAIQQANGRYGRDVATKALEFCWEERQPPTSSAYALFNAVCGRLAKESA